MRSGDRGPKGPSHQATPETHTPDGPNPCFTAICDSQLDTSETRGKTRITLGIDEDVLDCFLPSAEASGRAVGYQTLINRALRQHAANKTPELEDTLRCILREEIRAAS